MKGQRGRPNQGKTKSVKERTVNVYLPTVELKQEWKNSAKETSLSLSQFVTEAVERYREYGSNSTVSRTGGPEEDVESLKEELSKLKSNHAILEATNEKNEYEVKRLSELLEQRKQMSSEIQLARDMIFALRRRAKHKIPKIDIFFALGIKENDLTRIHQLREVIDFLMDSGLMDDIWGQYVLLDDFEQAKKNRVRYGEKIQTTE